MALRTKVTQIRNFASAETKGTSHVRNLISFASVDSVKPHKNLKSIIIISIEKLCPRPSDTTAAAAGVNEFDEKYLNRFIRL